jgi:hypothetical protein
MTDERILVAYIFFALYAPYPLEINPFKGALQDTFLKERNASSGALDVRKNEQLVWVLWKILKGEGSDVSRSIPCKLCVGSDRELS